AIADGFAKLEWDRLAEELDAKGYSHLSGVLPNEYCEEFIGMYDRLDIYRKTVTMARHRFGLGEYKYFSYPLPEIVQTIREVAYPKLAPVANGWAERLKIDVRYPPTFDRLQKLCRDAGQTKPTPLILKYGKGGFNTLHQDLYGEVYFPVQIAFFLNEPGKDYTGGEFVMTEQVPRAQSKVIVLTPRKGDMIVFTTNFRPVKGTRGYYRAAMRHGVSEVRSGVRHTLGVIFHDAVS
ncbi:MAG TPA: 2OG-Fe(II) oxygenase, partial [Pyrinomonadaceae bacterium]|nr:2OG-Fe(II) oxygenase [Pyrinomonadaceae bacterium]